MARITAQAYARHASRRSRPRGSRYRPAAPARSSRLGRLRTIPLPATRRKALPNVEAHITGTVWKIECEVGDEIEEGDTVAILESMKMEMPVEAEDDGKVKEIKCQEGQSVSEGDVLVVLE